MVSRKISLFSKMQRGRSPSFELLQLHMYAINYFNKMSVLPFSNMNNNRLYKSWTLQQ